MSRCPICHSTACPGCDPCCTHCGDPASRLNDHGLCPTCQAVRRAFLDLSEVAGCLRLDLEGHLARTETSFRNALVDLARDAWIADCERLAANDVDLPHPSPAAPALARPATATSEAA